MSLFRQFGKWDIMHRVLTGCDADLVAERNTCLEKWYSLNAQMVTLRPVIRAMDAEIARRGLPVQNEVRRTLRPQDRALINKVIKNFKVK